VLREPEKAPPRPPGEGLFYINPSRESPGPREGSENPKKRPKPPNTGNYPHFGRF